MNRHLETPKPRNYSNRNVSTPINETADDVAVPTPLKSPNIAKLPPLPKNSTLCIPKKRRISSNIPTTPTTPAVASKPRNFSSPTTGNTRGTLRVPSLVESPIPDLMPPPPANESYYSIMGDDPSDLSYLASPSNRCFSSPLQNMLEELAEDSPVLKPALEDVEVDLDLMIEGQEIALQDLYSLKNGGNLHHHTAKWHQVAQWASHALAQDEPISILFEKLGLDYHLVFEPC